ncbi:peptidoglycan endopeptidase [Bacillus xiapuensis]|uniref:peptidoglycan endopeptidase n=1 Tax=Bacillus xiapuensis TaxID=2014075 RepID=UPI000C24528F|nr:peptidoglycan endopeptidase [Bacillus xiapuensis]
MKKTLFTLSTAAVISAGAAAGAEAAENHVVKPGETLESIAKEYQTRADVIKSLNQLESDQVRVNQTLRIGEEQEAPPPAASSWHTVKAGETLYAIAKLYQMEVGQLKELNRLSSETLQIGQKLAVVNEARVSPAPSRTPAAGAPAKQASIYHEQAASASAAGVYTVRSGDTLFSIAKRHRMSVSQLQALNHLNNYNIYPGQKLKVRGTAAVKQSPSRAAVSAKTYVVQSGDSLSAIARAYHTTVTQLQKLNGLNSHFIYAGQKLKVSGKPSPVTPPAAKRSPVRPAPSAAYMVKGGDSLSKIASLHRLSVAKLKQLNGLTSDLIFPGQKLRVGGKPAAKPPAPSRKPAPKPSARSGMYIVQSGDSLSKIASRYNMSVTKLKQLNGLRSDLIVAGQKLKVSGQTRGNAPAPAKPAPKPAAPSVHTYAVKSGDTLGAIASRYRLSVAELKQLNGLRSDLIYVGQKLKVRGTASPSPKSSVTPPSQAPSSFSVSRLLAEAKKHMGTPYVWGGSKPSGFDCSGFIYYVFNQTGKKIPRTNTDGYYSRSYYVNKPQPGDLVFFVNTYKRGISHMGIYIGGNQFIQASSSHGITITSLDNSYFKQRFDSFKRFY